MMKTCVRLSFAFCAVTFVSTQLLFGDDPAKKDASKSDTAKNATSADDKSVSDKSATNQSESGKSETGKSAKHHGHHTFLGVYVSSAHPALAKNFGDALSPDQGLIVEDLAEDSPAAKAGIKAHDILTTFDDQKLFSAEQLAKLVHSDKAGREVSIGYLRDGKIQKLKATLGEVDSPRPRAWAHEHGGNHHGTAANRHMNHAGNHDSASVSEAFDSLTLKKTGDNKFHAEVQYLDKNGKNEKHVFDGTREEIKKSIESEKDLKPAERSHLLHSLNLTSANDDFGPLPFFLIPDWYFGESDDAS